MKKLTLLVIFLFSLLAASLQAQTPERTVKLVVSGEAETKEEATKIALRNAIEQAFGTFVSADTEILNDELIKDEIVTISSGNIQSYKEVSSIKNTDGSQSVTLEAIVSIGKLVNFAKSKGMSTELAGATFAMNMKIRELNKKNEIEVLADLQKKLLKIHQEHNLFDYKLDLSEPYEKDNCYAVKVNVEIIPNKNLVIFKNAIFDVLKSISLTIDEQEEYKKANLAFKKIKLKDYSNENDFLNALQIGDWEIRNKKYPPKYIEIALRNIDDYYPSGYFPMLVLRNQLQFAIKDNLGNIWYNVFTNVDVRNEVEIARGFAPEWAEYFYNLSKRNEVLNYYEFVMSGPKDLVAPIRNGFYQLSNEDFGFIIFDYRNKAYTSKALFSFEILYSKDDFAKLSSIDLFFQKPEFLESK